MPLPALRRRIAAHPAAAIAVAAAVLRAVVVADAWRTNPLVRQPQLDAVYYLNWGLDIARGDLAGTGGLVAGQPWTLNPLYAYVLAPFVGLLSQPLPWIGAFQAILGGATAGLAAAAAGRVGGPRAAWVAGILTAFASPLAHLDAHVAVAELSAFLVAGACFACAPDLGAAREGRPARGRGHGPVAAGLWLGIGALARPITPLALPLVAWAYARESPRKLRAAALVVVPFVLCALPSLLRNGLVSGEWATYTVAGGINVHLGNNAEARATRSMCSPLFRFNPVLMHEDGRRVVREALGREPTRSEVGAWFARTAVDEAVVRAPAESAAFYAHKARWFFGPVEIPSSASHALDARFSPLLALAFVPAWLVASLAAAGVVLCRREVLLGPGALALAHWAMLTLVFPLSHYRAPAIPALAVVGAAGAAAAWDAWRGGRRRLAAGAVACAAGAAVLGALPPGPDPLAFRDEALLALAARDRGDFEAAERHARDAMEAHRRAWGRDIAIGWEMIGEMQYRRTDWTGAADSFRRALEMDPNRPFVRCWRSHALQNLGDYAEAEREARLATEVAPRVADGWRRLADVLRVLPGRAAEAADAERRARDLERAPR